MAYPPRTSTSVIQPSSSIRRSSAKPAIGGERGIGLRGQKAGQHDAAARRDDPGQRRGEALQRLKQDIGEDEIERRAGADRRCGRRRPRARPRPARPTRLSRALARATRTAAASMSVASTRRRKARAAAMARTPEPVPRSRMFGAAPPARAICTSGRAPTGNRAWCRDGRCRRRARLRSRCRCG